MTTPSISVIVPTYGRDEPLRDTLVDLLTQDHPDYEILVIDQRPNHSPAIQQYLDQLAADGKIQLYLLEWASLPGARNFALRRAQKDIVLFIDDDVRLEPSFLTAHARNYERSDIGAVAGRVFDRMKLADAKNQRQTDEELVIDQLPPEALDPGIAWYHNDLVHTVKPQPVLTARGCNMSFRRDLLVSYDLWFDERFQGSAVREESDFCLRFRRTGLTIWYDPAAHLVHLGEETGGCHDISTRSLQYQFTFYHNHFFMGLKNLTLGQNIRFFAKLFDCHVLGHPPCYKSPSFTKTVTRGVFYTLGFCKAIGSQVSSLWDDGQIYSRQDQQAKT